MFSSASISPSRHRTWRGLVAAYAILPINYCPAFAQDPPPCATAANTQAGPCDAGPDEGGVTPFPRDYFTEFRPNSALDMINRVPGFSYSRGDGGVRGLAGSSGNVLIDGQRPVTKSLSLDDIIRRIPVDAVLRIDLIRGAAAGIDMQGQTMVANIIREPGGFSTVTAELMTKLYADHLPARNGRLEGIWNKGDWNASGGLAWRDEKEQGNNGTGRISRRDLIQGTVAAGKFASDWDRTEAQGNGTLEYRTGPHLLRLNLSGRRETELKGDFSELSGGSGLAMRESVITNAVETEGETSLDYEHAFSSGLIARVMLLQRLEKEKTNSVSEGRGVAQTSRNSSLEGESILRLATTYASGPALTFDASAEGSFNFLDARSRFLRDGIPVILPSANVRVEERRGNFNASARWQAIAGVSIDAGIAYETSTIGQSGDVDRDKSLAFWKPRASVTIDASPFWQLRFRGERRVGQLNFNDFAANISLEPGNQSAGNPDLVPETSLLIEAAIEHRFWERGAITLTANHAQVDNVIDLVPIDNRFDAPGNIGHGWRKEARLALTLPTEPLAIPGGQIRLNTTWRRSRVTDPVTGLFRRISRERPFFAEVFITKDVPNLKSIIGVDLYMGFRETSFRLNEIRSERSSSDPLARLYWDWTPSAKTTVRFQLENFTFRRRSRHRIFYQGSRDAGRIASVEDRSATLEPFLMFRLRHRL